MPISAAAQATYDAIANIQRVIATEEAPLADLQVQQTNVATATTKISGLAARLSALGAAAETLADPNGVIVTSASSNDAGVFAAASQSGPSATVGTYSVAVDRLATEHRLESYSKNTATTALNMSGLMEMRVGSTTANLEIVATDSLSDIAAKISASGLRVGATIASDGDGYKLAIRGLDTGAANTISFTQIGSGPQAGTHSVLALGLWHPSATTQTPQDAILSVDGVSKTSASNQVKDAIAGVTLALTAPTTAATITVSSQAVLEENLTTFVNAFNDVVTAAHNAAGHGGQAAAVSLLQDDQAVQTTLNRVSDLLVTPVLGTYGRYQTLDSIGLEAGQDGLLHLNTAKLTTALADHASGVARIFAAYDGTDVIGAMASFRETIAQLAGDSTTVLGSRLDGLEDQAESLEQSEQTIEDRLGTYRTILHDLAATLAQQLGTTEP